MRSTFHIAVATLVAWCAAGCGNLENAPFRVGTVHGQLTESDPAVAMVSLVGQPGVSSPVDADGRFTLEDVPTGMAELFIIATTEKAARVQVRVLGGQSVQVQPVAPTPASFLDLHVKTTNGFRLSAAEASVEGTPFQRLLLDAKGRLRVGPLPDGCYTVTVTALGFPATQVQDCAGPGEKKELKVDLVLDESLLGQGCQEIGCEEGLVCAPNKKCLECFGNSHCGEGLTCKGNRCEGPGPQCAPCTGDWQCAAGTHCEVLPEGSAACATRCGGDDDAPPSVQAPPDDDGSAQCAPGFTCQSGRCLPDAANFAGCHALRRMDAPCTDDASCHELGLLEGRCVSGACTAPCATDLDCPGSRRCVDSSAGRVCQAGT
ncbi:carboxypeptidase regulatory-like domain-containing protein [Myxococcus xanthus]|uniref:carboxypeptidase-like regulatory domain-containing protein n=1 Tax=Myxococcus xanthus TaxID=34 RepID=UPI001916EA3D|nr:carboxypeptidase-like regulatory domain-containing protein [Myxococcus xanthus]QQR42347.1 carboxypeptidase regulatory-like domain-containing protein [Myxococcus xanthus]